MPNTGLHAPLGDESVLTHEVPHETSHKASDNGGKPGPCEPIKQINASELPVFPFSGQRESSSAQNDLASEPGKLSKTSPWKVIFLVAPYA